MTDKLVPDWLQEVLKGIGAFAAGAWGVLRTRQLFGPRYRSKSDAQDDRDMIRMKNAKIARQQREIRQLKKDLDELRE